MPFSPSCHRCPQPQPDLLGAFRQHHDPHSTVSFTRAGSHSLQQKMRNKTRRCNSRDRISKDVFVRETRVKRGTPILRSSRFLGSLMVAMNSTAKLLSLVLPSQQTSVKEDQVC